MKELSCDDLERVLRDRAPGESEALAAHAVTCMACAEQLRRFDALSSAARSLRRDFESPGLWQRIEKALDEDERRRSAMPFPRRLVTEGGALHFLRAAAVVALASLVVGGAYRLVRGRQALPPSVARDADDKLLTEQALADVEAAEKAYVRSIDRLQSVVSQRLESGASPLLVSYREKLLVIDAAIAECRAQVLRNRFNAHLRRELLSMYLEKQRTLQQVMEARNDVS
jgi:pimeloyl-ACP methyl ester carboxylesterase